MKRITSGALLALAGLLAMTDTQACTPISGPTVITVSGDYCLDTFLLASSFGISIAAPDVSIDMNGFGINCQRYPRSVGITVFPHMYNTRIRNGRIVSCDHGIDAWGYVSFGLRISDVEVHDASHHAITAWGDWLTLERVKAYNTGPSRTPGVERVIAIEVACTSDCVVDAAYVENTRSVGPVINDAVGLSCSFGARCLFLNPVVINRTAENWEYAIWIGGEANVKVINATIDGFRDWREIVMNSQAAVHVVGDPLGLISVNGDDPDDPWL